MSKSKKATVVLLSFGLVAAASMFFYFKKTNAATPYRTMPVERGDIAATVNATGTVNAVTTVQVGSQVSGTITKLYADFNSVVKTGQVIVQLDSTFLSAQVKGAAANLEKAQVAVNGAKRDLDRADSLFKRNLLSQAELDAALTAYESAIAGAKQSQAALELAKTNLRYSTIRSPISGVVISRNVDVGQTVAASLQAPTLFTIANDLRKMEVETNIDEADIGKIRESQSATFTVDAYPDRPFTGTVMQIRLAPMIQQNVVTYNVVIAVDNPELKLMPGMTANVSILVDHQEHVLKITNAALRFRPGLAPAAAGGSTSFAVHGGSSNSLASSHGKFDTSNKNRATVWTLSPDGKPEPVQIQTGINDGSFTEIVAGGLREGQQVITGTQMHIATPMSAPGMPGIPGSGSRRGI